MKANEFSKEALEKVPQRDLVSVPSPFPPLPPGQSSFSAERLPTAAQDSFGQSHGHCWFCRVDTRDEKNPPYGSSADILFKKYVRQVERLERKQEALITDTQPEVERLQLMVTKSTRLVYFLIIVNIAVLLLCFFFALFPIHLTGVPAESPENAAIADTPPIDDLPVRAYPMTPPSSPQPFLSSVSPRHATKKTEQQASSMSSAHRGLTERSSTQPKQPLGKPGYPLGYRSSEKRQQTSASQGQPRYLEAQHLAPAPASAPTVFAPLPQLWRLPVEAFKDLAIILKIKADSSKQQAASTKLLTSAAAEEEAYPHKLQTGETKFKKKITFHTGETLDSACCWGKNMYHLFQQTPLSMRSGSAILYGANSTLIQQWDFENEDTDPFVGMVNADGGRTLEKHYRDSSEELEREYRDDVFTQRSVESGTRQQLDSGAVSEQFASFSPTSAGPRGAASSLVNGSSSEAVERVTADNVPDAELTGESARGDGTAVHGARALVTSARQYQQPMKLSRREGKTALAGLEAGSNDPSSLSVRDKPIATADAEEETKTKTKASEAGPPPEIPNKQEATVATATDWEVRTSTPTRGRRLMAAAVMGLANAFDQFARLGGALLSPAVSMAQTLDVAGALLANPQSASAALGGTGLPPYMSPTGFGISGAGAVPYGAYGAPVQGPVTAGIVANSPRAPMAVNTGIPVSSLGPATVAVAPQQLYTSSSTLSAPQQVYYYTGGAPGSAYLTASTQLDPTLLTYSPLLGGGLGGGPYNAVTVSTNSDGPLYVIARGQENDPTQGLTDAGQSPAHGAVSLSTSLGAPLRRLEGLPSIRGTRGLDSSEGVTSREVQAASPAPMIRRSGLGKLKAPVDARANENAVRSSSEPATFSKPELASCQRDSGQKMSGEGCRSLLGISHDESMPTSNANFARQHAGVIHQGTAAYVASDARGPPGNKVAGTSTICHPD
ncbi:transmembrane protein [Cystoisospora suis]|uniref:Transmembrane protein n=1 Tax=Cystoisospora suis TaxID=483139 RepID=A0A2C6KYE8_9APIC|nr:transmembrane protein [Cystoisospora suis]